MNKNTRTYVLLAAVLLIWGTIGYRIWQGLRSEPDSVSLPLPVTTTTLLLPEADTVTLMANYRDPFLGTLPQPKASEARMKKAPMAAPQRKIVFTGSMGSKGATRIFFVTIDGQAYLLKKGQVLDGVRLLSGSATSITVQYAGRTRKINLKP